jgi:agmatinase
MPRIYPAHKPAFLGLSEDESGFAKSRFVIVPVPFENTTTYRKGTANGPAAIIDASQEVELYDEELQGQPYLAGIFTHDKIAVGNLSSKNMIDSVANVSAGLIDESKIACIIGGEHTVSVGSVKTYSEKFSDLSVLQLDAHADLRELYQDNEYSHACVMRRIRDFTKKTVAVGVRNISVSEQELIEAENIPVIHAREMQESSDWIEKVLENLSENVYLTIDCDYFDPAIMPAVGTPEPGGGQWYQTLDFLKTIIERKNVVGFDVVELAPLPVNNVSEFTVAKLIYKMIGYISMKNGYIT